MTATATEETQETAISQEEKNLKSIAQRLGVADDTIAALKDRYTGLTAETPAKYKQVTAAIADVRKTRVGVEHSRKALKERALEYCRAVDFEAKRITGLLEEIEEPLKAQKALVDDEKARAKAAKAKAEQDRIEAELKAKREAEEAERRRLEAERIAEQKKIAAEQKAERERLEKLQAEINAKEAAAKAERDAIRAEREALDRERFEAETRRKAEDEAARKAMEAQQAAEQAERDRLELQAKVAAMAPDAAKLEALTWSIKRVDMPLCKSQEACDIVDYVSGELARVAAEVESHVRRLKGKDNAGN